MTWQVAKLVSGTFDPAFVINGSGIILAWNEAAEALFGVSQEIAVHSTCASIVRGVDECGSLCSPDCMIKQAIIHRRAVRNFDVQVKTPQGMQWCNVTTVLLRQSSALPQAMLILRPIELTKRMELLFQDFVKSEVQPAASGDGKTIRLPRNLARNADLTTREREILHHLATGLPGSCIAVKMKITRTTVNNHIQHILKKLNAHSRLEALRRAEAAGLL